ncbi:hypothetical protein TRIATDRAFT_305104 [Trichoderma atroviride IMI 206040]|uniref:Dynamin stalk domain-containing protein n=1 Tax=Hypocrea atroviridis (strain ATCC 20476 / IMI 206040) TaxID=452589 RepID=G9NK42_HYPAI|nr:uncharacterized protein TRIATDRAFT_305104 [Trichoderma atroviride IMI 206040]EHK49262.1 hypothetical protein TRIATDRAFT_305104 [Trichoderma atroviride IMI 206040]
MGLRTDPSTENGTVFSKDVLKMEMIGPQEDHLTILEVTGIFRTAIQGTTTNTDMELPHKDYDKIGERTLCVLTKADLVLEPTAQATVRNLVLGNKRPLSLGYLHVRNREADGSFQQQSELDRELQKQEWIDLPKDQAYCGSQRSA